MIPGALAALFNADSNSSFVYGIASGVNTSTIDLPANVSAGDFIVVVSFDPIGDSSLNTATGFNFGDDIKSSGAIVSKWSYLNATGSLSQISGLTARGKCIHLAVVFRGVTIPTSVINKKVLAGRDSAPNPPNVSLLSGQYPCFAFCYAAVNTSVPSPTLPDGFDLAANYATSAATITIAYQLYFNSSSLNPSAFGGYAGSKDWITATVAFTNTPS